LAKLRLDEMKFSSYDLMRLQENEELAHRGACDYYAPLLFFISSLYFTDKQIGQGVVYEVLKSAVETAKTVHDPGHLELEFVRQCRNLCRKTMFQCIAVGDLNGLILLKDPPDHQQVIFPGERKLIEVFIPLLAELPHYIALDSYYLKGKSIEKTGYDLGETPGVVSSKLSRMREGFRAVYEKEFLLISKNK